MNKFFKISLLIVPFLFVLFPAKSSFAKSANVLSNFTDVPSSHWAVNSINEAKQRGLMTGKGSPSTFKPDDLLTRAESAAVFNRLFAESSINNLVNYFKDVEQSHWAYKDILRANYLGTMSGYEDGTFKPDQPITRAEISSVFLRLIEGSDFVVPNLDKELSFSDVPSSHWAYKSIKTSYHAFGISGYPDGTFKPSNNITRAEMASLITRYLNYSMTQIKK